MVLKIGNSTRKAFVLKIILICTFLKKGVNGGRASVMIPATEMHVDSPEDHIALTDREVKAWDGEEIQGIPPSTQTGLFLNPCESRHECHFYAAKNIKAWRSARAQECFSCVSWKTNKRKICLDWTWIERKRNSRLGGSNVTRFSTTQWKWDNNFPSFTGVKGSNILRLIVHMGRKHGCLWTIYIIFFLLIYTKNKNKKRPFLGGRLKLCLV